MYDVFLICPVRNANEETVTKIRQYKERLKRKGKTLYYPGDDTDQNDAIGFRICTDNKNALANSKEVHIWYDKNSQGSLFDLGMAFALNKPLVIVNPEEIEITPHKSFGNMILEWNKK